MYVPAAGAVTVIVEVIPRLMYPGVAVTYCVWAEAKGTDATKEDMKLTSSSATVSGRASKGLILKSVGGLCLINLGTDFQNWGYLLRDYLRSRNLGT